jgi:hypothetical protein
MVANDPASSGEMLVATRRRGRAVAGGFEPLDSGCAAITGPAGVHAEQKMLRATSALD